MSVTVLYLGGGALFSGHSELPLRHYQAAAGDSEGGFMRWGCPSARSFVCLSCRKKAYTKTRFSQKLSNLQLESLLRKSYMGLSMNPLMDPLKFKMADIRHLENRQIAISQRTSSPAVAERPRGASCLSLTSIVQYVECNFRFRFTAAN